MWKRSRELSAVDFFGCVGPAVEHSAVLADVVAPRSYFALLRGSEVIAPAEVARQEAMAYAFIAAISGRMPMMAAMKA